MRLSSHKVHINSFVFPDAEIQPRSFIAESLYEAFSQQLGIFSAFMKIQPNIEETTKMREVVFSLPLLLSVLFPNPMTPAFAEAEDVSLHAFFPIADYTGTGRRYSAVATSAAGISLIFLLSGTALTRRRAGG